MCVFIFLKPALRDVSLHLQKEFLCMTADIDLALTDSDVKRVISGLHVLYFLSQFDTSISTKLDFLREFLVRKKKLLDILNIIILEAKSIVNGDLFLLVIANDPLPDWKNSTAVQVSKLKGRLPQCLLTLYAAIDVIFGGDEIICEGNGRFVEREYLFIISTICAAAAVALENIKTIAVISTPTNMYMTKVCHHVDVYNILLDCLTVLPSTWETMMPEPTIQRLFCNFFDELNNVFLLQSAPILTQTCAIKPAQLYPVLNYKALFVCLLSITRQNTDNIQQIHRDTLKNNVSAINLCLTNVRNIVELDVKQAVAKCISFIEHCEDGMSYKIYKI